jgi:hypothetical protein
MTSTNRVATLTSATTHPTTYHASEASIETKYGISGSQFEHFGSTLKKEEDDRVKLLAERKRSYTSEQSNDFLKGNINENFNQVADDLDSQAKFYEDYAHQYLHTHETELLSSKNST